MLAVGIDISKSKSVAAILNQDGSMHTSPFEFHHTQPELDAFIKYILNSNQSATILMENTGHYHYPVLKAFREAGLPVCMVNAYQIKKFGDMDLRKAKTDKKDAVRIARYAFVKLFPSKQNIFRLDFVLFCDGANHPARHTRRNDPGRDIMRHHAARADDRTLTNRHAAADRGVCTNPDIILQCDGGGSTDTVTALFRINSVTRTGKAYPRRNKSSVADMYRGSVQNHAVVVDDCQTVRVDIKAIVTVKTRLNSCHGTASAE